MEWEIKGVRTGVSFVIGRFPETRNIVLPFSRKAISLFAKIFAPHAGIKIKMGGHFILENESAKKDKSAQPVINMDVLLDVFMRLEGNNETHQRNLRYVLALYLIRKKVFKLKSLKKQDKEESIILYYPKEDREFTVVDLNLKEEEVEAITAEMCQLLNYPYFDHEVPVNTT